MVKCYGGVEGGPQSGPPLCRKQRWIIGDPKATAPDTASISIWSKQDESNDAFITAFVDSFWRYFDKDSTMVEEKIKKTQANFQTVDE